jgi:hypothetical protein
VTLLPVDRLLVGYHALLIAVWLPAAPGTAALAMIGLHLTAIALAALMARTPGGGPIVAALRQVYPPVWCAALWHELGLHWSVAGSRTNDLLLLAVETRVLGFHAAAAWAAAAPYPALAALMDVAYLAYYPLMLLVPLALLAGRSRWVERDVTLRLVATYLACFAVYAVFPAVGPRALAGDGAADGGRLLAGVAGALRAVGDAAGTAFPSSHVAGSLTAALLAWRHGSRRLAWAASATAAAIVPATVYTGNHYVVDAAAGIALVTVVQLVLVPLATRPRAPRAAPAPRDIAHTVPEAA